ncbi:MAG: hypothetical protein AB1403_16045 [Candidatus Riflebacteria bacterium]
MKNELNWVSPEGQDFPMKMVEKGLSFNGKTALVFYFSGFVAILSMLWVMALSVKLIFMTQQDPNIPEYYKTVAIICIGISAASLFSFYKIYRERSAYSKEIEIADGTVSFCETTRKGKTEWQEKVRKYEGVFLRHYSYRGVDSWYVALVHADSSKSLPVFAADFDSRQASEDEKRRILAQYGSRFGLMTTFERKEEKKKEA